MPTLAIAGYAGRMYLSIDGGGTFPEVGEIQDLELDEDVDMLDATSHSSGGAKEVVPGISSWKASIGALYVSSDVGQDNLFTALNGKTKVQVRIDPEGSVTGKERWTGSGFINTWKNTGPTTDLAKISAEVMGSGALTKGTVP